MKLYGNTIAYIFLALITLCAVIFIIHRIERAKFLFFAEEYLIEAYDRGYEQGFLKCAGGA